MNESLKLWKEAIKSGVVKYRNWIVVFLTGFFLGALTIIFSWVM